MDASLHIPLTAHKMTSNNRDPPNSNAIDIALYWYANLPKWRYLPSLTQAKVLKSFRHSIACRIIHCEDEFEGTQHLPELIMLEAEAKSKARSESRPQWRLSQVIFCAKGYRGDFKHEWATLEAKARQSFLVEVREHLVHLAIQCSWGNVHYTELFENWSALSRQHDLLEMEKTKHDATSSVMSERGDVRTSSTSHKAALTAAPAVLSYPPLKSLDSSEDIGRLSPSPASRANRVRNLCRGLSARIRDSRPLPNRYNAQFSTAVSDKPTDKVTYTLTHLQNARRLENATQARYKIYRHRRQMNLRNANSVQHERRVVRMPSFTGRLIDYNISESIRRRSSTRKKEISPMGSPDRVNLAEELNNAFDEQHDDDADSMSDEEFEGNWVTLGPPEED
ncbi:hypothetical protein EJ08DRAFT_698607 [Tothia fuscella]|uniref:Uncharacterized protein n=1 Tax=Tothia fuscella TaxID=1048955 RepID=A0A9P4NPP3_9PEZI|nr:hypothetical protein EJ08DRAFT_698607 [Tothia fuscella]